MFYSLSGFAIVGSMLVFIGGRFLRCFSNITMLIVMLLFRPLVGIRILPGTADRMYAKALQLLETMDINHTGTLYFWQLRDVLTTVRQVKPHTIPPPLLPTRCRIPGPGHGVL